MDIVKNKTYFPTLKEQFEAVKSITSWVAKAPQGSIDSKLAWDTYRYFVLLPNYTEPVESLGTEFDVFKGMNPRDFMFIWFCVSLKDEFWFPDEADKECANHPEIMDSVPSATPNKPANIYDLMFHEWEILGRVEWPIMKIFNDMVKV